MPQALRLLFLAGLLIAAAAAAPAASAQVGTAYCFGVGCPCGNDDPEAGCGNGGVDGDAGSGARLEAFGSPDVLRDDLVLRVGGVKPGAFGVVFMGATPVQAPFGDGLRCVGAGGVGTFRFPPRPANTDGAYLEEGLVARSQTFQGGTVQAGSTWYFQGWFRDSGGPCASGFNLTHGLEITFESEGSDAPIATQLAGRPLAEFPYFEHPRAFNEGSDLYVAVDPRRHPSVADRGADLFVVEARTDAEWRSDSRLVDARGASQPLFVSAAGVRDNTFLVDAGGLSGTTGSEVGIGYDVVLDVDKDGVLGPGDLIDGLSAEAGAYVVRDVVQPGPHGVSEIRYSGGSFLQQVTYFPTDIDSLGELPLVVISHGNGHNYLWYDHIGMHLASYGYVVMSHRNNTMPGSHAASTTTLTNTDYLLGNLGIIEGGVLEGHVDGHRITWIGHSRGGDGIARAYDRLFDGTYVPTHFGIEDIVLLSSIAPVDFGGTGVSDPHGVNFHLWTGSADGDVNGGPNLDTAQTFHLLDRATGNRMATTLHGVGHGVFHNGGGSFVASGPCLNGRQRIHPILRGYFVPLLAHFVRGDVPSKDFLWRQWEGFTPISATVHECISVQLEYVDGPESGNFVIDDFQSQPDASVSSCGGAVTFDVENLFEGRLDDANNNFTDNPDDPMNGMTRARPSDSSAGVVFDWSTPSFLEFELPATEGDLTDDAYLSLKACQAARHPNTIAELDDLTFDLTLRDRLGRTSSISVGVHGGGVEEPYQRTGAGMGAGWANEFETLRLRIADFARDGVALDLGQIEAVRLDFGGPGHSPLGRIGLDQIEITKD